MKSIVIFDGSNFYHSVKRLTPSTHLTHFNYRLFSEKISKDQNVKIIYCVGEIKQVKGNQKSIQMYSQQQALFYSLTQQKIQIYKGFMLKDGEKYHEKGVDVRIATEIIKGALKKEYSNCFLISSDTDLIPAIIEAKKAKTKVIYVGFKNFISKALQKNCSKTIVVGEDMF